MQEALIVILVCLLIFVGFPWMAANWTFGEQIAACGVLIAGGLLLPLIHDIMTDE
jgi:hypothetical protein